MVQELSWCSVMTYRGSDGEAKSEEGGSEREDKCIHSDSHDYAKLTQRCGQLYPNKNELT